ncbi:class I SAM-dependent methyltransferase [Aurantimonas coralicida]|uniref:class I SAM-dependent methyltransferase n=1 Tax=Aurantimonas coralicida TaxID=182270 RepID=UPI001D192597|nr:class I SAM-dependent methyltransferase [Aurantimonas coralicida]MCC4297742.1 methyltransferase domain-containing protein [Aurantimonas coralicida]
MSDSNSFVVDRDGAFYRSFEDRFRGSRGLIKGRLGVYQPFLKALDQTGLAGRALDIGCGRGEWLEILLEAGFSAQGVDSDEGMLAICVQLGLPAERGDALDVLNSLPSESLSVVSGFHIAEHLSFDVLRRVVKESHRVLKPGGLLILETPNPENMRVSTLTFHLDSTHNRPLPPELLEFLGGYYGFARTTIFRLQADMDASEFEKVKDIKLSLVLEGVSPDYSLVAQKAADADVMRAFDRLFAQEIGVTYARAVGRFEQNIVLKFDEVRAELGREIDANLTTQLNGLRLSSASARLDQLEAEVDKLHRALQASPSWIAWQLMRTLRQGVSSWLRLSPGSRPQRVMGRLARAGVGYLRVNPRAKSMAVRLSAIVPPLQARLLRFAATQRSTSVEIDFLAERQWYLEPEPAEQAKWTKFFADNTTPKNADR